MELKVSFLKEFYSTHIVWINTNNDGGDVQDDCDRKKRVFIIAWWATTSFIEFSIETFF